MSNLIVILLCLACICFIPVLVVSVTAWMQEAGRLLHYAIKTHRPDDIVNASVYWSVSFGLLAVVAMLIDKYAL